MIDPMEPEKYFKHPETGKVGAFSDRAAQQFPNLIPVEDDGPCVDCLPEEVDEDFDFEEDLDV